MSAALAALLLAAAPLAASQGCGATGQACCDSDFCEAVDAFCDPASSTCKTAVPGTFPCEDKGSLGQECCSLACTGDGIICTAGECIDRNAEEVFDQSGGPPAGAVGGMCIGVLKLCDESEEMTLECIDGLCSEPPTPPGEVQDQSGPGFTCGDLNQSCCYDDPEGALCASGRCAPPEAEPGSVANDPCVCSSTVCVLNVLPCAADEICDQSGTLEPCGALGEVCCDGLECNEDVFDDNGRAIVLLCDQDFFDAETGKVTQCAEEEEEALDQSFGTGAPAEKCNPDGTCDDADHACTGGVCKSNVPCAAPGDECCEGGTCEGEYLTCDTYGESMFNNVCTRCGGEGQICCESGSDDAFCAGSNLFCQSMGDPSLPGICLTQPGPCDTVAKGCCANDATGSHYCTASTADRLTCDVTPDGDSTGLLCTTCGDVAEPCCLSSSADVMNATPTDLALGPHMCNEENLGCMIDAGNANFFGQCTECGNKQGDPCCWQMRSVQESDFLNTASDVLFPYCSKAGLTCQEYKAEDTFGYTDARNFYRCVPEVPDQIGVPMPAPGRCGGFNQPCCNSGAPLTQCGMGLACNLDTVLCEECGQDDQLCCPSLVPEMSSPVCEAGFGCNGTTETTFDRRCSTCGGTDAPCCWTMWQGFFCGDGFECSGTVGVDQMCKLEAAQAPQ